MTEISVGATIIWHLAWLTWAVHMILCEIWPKQNKKWHFQSNRFSGTDLNLFYHQFQGLELSNLLSDNQKNIFNIQLISNIPKYYKIHFFGKKITDKIDAVYSLLAFFGQYDQIFLIKLYFWSIHRIKWCVTVLIR